MKLPWKSHHEGDAPWPVVLTDESGSPPITLRPLRFRDEIGWHRVRADNANHVQPWEPTLPPGVRARPVVSFRQFVKDLDAEARADHVLPWVVDVGGRIVGQVHIFGIVRGAQQSGAVGYWLDNAVVGHGIATRAVALAIDHSLRDAGLHRIEVNIRLDNQRSLAIMRRLGLRDEGVRERFLHIDGAWRDHRSFAVTAEEIGPGGLLARLPD
ncbi:MAG: GNAT family N-acetyltransferase [Intrasporangium sp.]|uniref:GNAT family N-acetyltransferase n=1 Tax=Intrasporangium sp. TaxID=1925024 RepID=UPI002647465D|nr:GNAT family protein [Intrasporangium sp.]MDN5795332.1 GNAT family N-acetyltransferase [Intrasporangium sp.]